jgi:hypothetical protein
MLDSDFLRRQAELCLNLSRATFDLVIARRLRTMAEELEAKAAALDDRMRVPAEDEPTRCGSTV